MKTLILHTGADTILNGLKNLSKKEFDFVNPYIENKFFRFFRYTHRKLNLPFFFNFWINPYFKDEKKYDRIIVFDSPVWFRVIGKIKSKFSNSKLIFWYWNTVKDKLDLELVKNKCDSVYSFDKNDCKKYNITYHPQIYWKSNVNSNTYQFDFLFVGYTKGRLKEIENIYTLIKGNYKSFFHVLKSKKNEKSDIIDFKSFGIKYDFVVKSILKSRCIIDLNKKNQTGLTLRPLEAVFLRRKLITNNRSIKFLDFYDSSFIYILGEENRTIENFMKIKSKFPKKSIINKYDIRSWANKII